MAHLLLRVDDTARLFVTATSEVGDQRIDYVDSAIADHFERANEIGESWGDLWYVPAQGDGPLVACEVTETRSEFSDDNYAVAEVLISPSDQDFSYRVAYRIDGHS